MHQRATRPNAINLIRKGALVEGQEQRLLASGWQIEYSVSVS